MFGLSFLSPAFLAGALVAALPIALHLLGRRPRQRVLFPAVRLLKRAPAQETRRRRVRELVLLALRVGAICLLALAFARPYFAHSSPGPSRAALVVALDRSFSMSAPGEFERALSLARGAVAQAAPGAAVGLLTFDDDAQVVVKPGHDRTAVLNALARVRVGYGGTSYAAALARAAEALGPAGGRIVVVTDLQRHGWDRADAAIPDRVAVSVRDAGGPTSNLAVSDVRAGDAGVTALVRNSGPTRRTGRARLAIDGRVRAVLPFAVDGGAVQQIVFPGRAPSSGAAAVEIEDGIGYQADDTAYALLDPPEPPSLLALVGQGDPSRGSFYLERALQVDGARLFHLDTQPAGLFAATVNRAALDRYAAVFLLGTRGLTSSAAASLGEYVGRGGGLFVAVDDQVEPARVDAILGTRLSVSFQTEPRSIGLLAADARHPVLAALDADALTAVRVDRVARPEVPHAEVLARFGDGSPALLELRRDAGRVLVFGSDVSNRWNDLPLQPAFLPFVHQVARYLAGDRLPARDFVVSAVPDGVPRQPGLVTMPATAPAPARGLVAKRIVVNVDPHESDVGRMSVAQFEQMIPRAGGPAGGQVPVDRAQGEQQQALWRLAIAVAIAALLTEGLIGRMARE